MIFTMDTFYKLVLCICFTLSSTFPTEPEEKLNDLRNNNFASDASKLIATNLLKSYIDIDGNQAHSPLGVSSILAVLAEGAAGETYNEFNKVFGDPQRRSSVRDSFKRVLNSYNNREYSSAPSFQTWFYVYRNFSAREDFKRLIHENYYVEVKDINRSEFDWSDPNTALDFESTTVSNSKDVIGFETLKRLEIDGEEANVGETPQDDSFGDEVMNKDASKFDRFVDDKQYVEKPVILAEIKQQQAEILQKKDQVDEKESSIVEIENSMVKDQKEQDLDLEDNETVHEDEKIRKNYNDEKDLIPIKEVLESNEPEKVSLPLQKLESAIQAATQEAGEIMLALESHISSVRRALGARSLFRKDDIASALSANSITGREIGSKTKMLLFNGLYYRGNWARPFFEQPGSTDYFYMTNDDASKIPMMQATGMYYTAELPHLNAKALCIPYENKKYSMMVIIPNDIEGLRSVIEGLQPADFSFAKRNAMEKELRVIMPKFQVEETSRSEAMLKSLGLQKLFSREEADLSLLSEDPNLHVDEIVQFVNVRVDEGGSSENSLSASTLSGGDAKLSRTSETDTETFNINRPFLYFILDCEEEFVIASGKISAPEVKDDLPPVSIEVEFEQA